MDDLFDEGSDYEVVMPFVVCDDHGGPYESDSFVAGFYLGEATAIIRLCQSNVLYRRWVPTPLVPQLDLLAMKENAHMRSTPWEEFPDSWTYVEIQAAPFEQ